jgi:hypothetical protein
MVRGGRRMSKEEVKRRGGRRGGGTKGSPKSVIDSAHALQKLTAAYPPLCIPTILLSQTAAASA